MPVDRHFLRDRERRTSQFLFSVSVGFDGTGRLLGIFRVVNESVMIFMTDKGFLWEPPGLLIGEIGEDIPVRGSWFALVQGYFADCRYTAWFLSGHPEAEQDCS